MKAMLIGLEEPMRTSLGKALAPLGASVLSTNLKSISECARAIHAMAPDLVFCNVEYGLCQALLVSLGGPDCEVPVVAVSRLPEVSDWLDALEAGAREYCAAPFEPRQIRWILDNIFQYSSAARALCSTPAA